MNWRNDPPSPEDYVTLRAAASLGPRSLDAARRGLAQTLFAVTVTDDGALLAMGRVIGDGGCFVQLVDIAVHPSAQGRGLGREITQRLVAWCEENLPPDCHLSLVSSARAVPLYETQGFRLCRGMDRLVDPARSSPS